MRLAAGLILALAALAAGAGPASALPDKPDLVIRVPGQPEGGRVAPVFVDAYEQPGRLLYRFDAIIANQGGTLDLFRGPDGDVRQAVWPGGEPSEAQAPRPDEDPPASTWIAARPGATLEYAEEKTHEHFHLSSAARYELQPQGGAPRAAEKVGFCLFDSHLPDADNWFDYNVRGAHNETWCGFNRPDQSAVRMGLSPGGADIYTAQHERQWVDITGLAPGPVEMRAEANPLRCVLESDEANNTVADARQIPGVKVVDAQASTGAAPVGIALSGTVVAPDVPARRSGRCLPGRTTKGCYVWTSATGPLTFRVTREPAHGTVALAPGANGLRAVATYTPDAGFSGADSFTYAATDARGLSSRSATVRVSATAPPPAPAAPVTAAPPAAILAPQLSRIRVVRRRGRWFVTLHASVPALVSGRLQRRSRGRRVTRRVRSVIVDGGAERLALGRLAPGRYRLRLLLDGKPAGNAVFTVPKPRRF